MIFLWHPHCFIVSIIMQLFFTLSYCCDIMGEASLLCLEGSYNLPILSCSMFYDLYVLALCCICTNYGSACHGHVFSEF